MDILREFYYDSKTDLVFSRSGNITPKLYRILKELATRGSCHTRSVRLAMGLVLP